MANEKLSKAKAGKNDEFYTQFEDIQREVEAYLEYNPDVFRDKTILLPCDDPEWSNFTKFFAQNFERFGLKKLISTSYAYIAKNAGRSEDLPLQLTLFETEDPQYDSTITKERGKIFTLTRRSNRVKPVDINDLKWKYLEGDGDFRSEEVKKLRNEADIIITNPPFSLFREFVAWIMEADKKFLIIGNQNAITYKEIFPLLKDNKVWLGKGFKGGAGHFINKYYTDYATAGDHREGMIRVSGVVWFTNLDHGRRHQPLSLMSMKDNIKYSKHKEIKGKSYMPYVTFDAIDIPYSDSIPKDYSGIMGVPKSFMDVYCCEQFELLGFEREDETIQVGIRNMPEEFLSDYRKHGGKGHYTKGMKMLCYYDSDGNPRIPFSRILIRYTQDWIKKHPDDFKE